MARRLYPHDRLADDVYLGILDDAVTAAAGDDSLVADLQEAELALDSYRSRDFLELDENAQIEALKSVQNTEFFAAIQAAVRSRLYSHPEFWALIGYEGPSYQRGGYLNRGAGDIDWLPEA